MSVNDSESALTLTLTPAAVGGVVAAMVSSTVESVLLFIFIML